MVDSGTFKTTSYLQETKALEGVASGVLLSNTRKEEQFKDAAALAARRGIDPSSELGKLDVCFGGFSPTAMGRDIPMLKQLAEAVEQRNMALSEAKRRAAEVEAARASEAREFADGCAQYKYVVLDDAEIRIEKAVTNNADLSIPAEIEGKPVMALAADSFSDLESVASIKMSDSIVAIGYSAFRNCRRLESIEFPSELAKFDSGWLRGCQKLAHMKLPGKLEKITPAIFDIPSIRHLEIGRMVGDVMSGAFQKSQLESVSVSDENPFIMSDGSALYSKDGSILVVLAVPLQQYSVADGCMALGKKAFSGFECVQEVKLPATLRIVGDFACTRTSIRNFVAPASLVAIGERAFFACKELRCVILNDGLESIASNAFSDTSISELRVPSSICELGNPIATGTSLTYSGKNATFSIGKLPSGGTSGASSSLGAPEAPRPTAASPCEFDGASLIPSNSWAAEAAFEASGAPVSLRVSGASDVSKVPVSPDISEAAELSDVSAESKGRLMLDEAGGLYRNGEDGLHLVRMLEPSASEYVVREGTVAIDEGAFAKHPEIMQVVLPESLKSIGQGAFKDARKLVDVNLPRSIESVGEEAFLDTAIAHLEIPASLTRIGVNALATYGAHHGNIEPALRHIEVHPENPRFYMSSGLLIERMDGLERVVLCTGEEPNVVVPESVTAIGSYAFHGVRTLKTLAISDRITMVEIRGLAFDSMVDNVRVDLVEPIDGHEFFDFSFPKTSRGVHQMGHAFGTPNFVNVEAIFDHYDNSIVNRSGFDGSSDHDQLSPYEQAQRIIDRLNDPVLISTTNKNLMEGVLTKHLGDICMEAARHDDKSLIEGLLDLGYITKDNIGEVLEAVATVQDASITNYLLEQKRTRFGTATIDFSL